MIHLKQVIFAQKNKTYQSLAYCYLLYIHLDFNDIKYSKYDGPIDITEEEEEYELMRELHLQLNELRNITIEADEPSLPIVDKGRVSKTIINQQK